MIKDFDQEPYQSNLYQELRLRIWQARYQRLKRFVLNVLHGVWLGSFVLAYLAYGAWEYSRRVIPVAVHH